MKNILALFFLLQVNITFCQAVKPKCLDGNCKNKIGTYIYSDSSIYMGSFVDKLRSGQGKITFKNKSTYDGQWLNDKRNGIGVYIDSVGNKYEGLWVDDKENGAGKYTDTKGNVYEGTWTNGTLKGYITLRYKNKNLYEGEYDNGIRGKGKFSYADGSIYSGNFAKNKRSGYGEMVYSFGLTYKGNWVSNEVDGQGQFYLTSTQVKIAEGVWKTDKSIPNDTKFISSDGLMVCYYANKNLYYGKSQEGLPNSSGIMNYSNGDVYEGNFVKGVHNGNGKLKLKDKSEYNGNWKSGKKDGYGTLTKADKTTIKGYWSSDNYLGLEMPVFQNLGQINCEFTPSYYLYDKFFLCLESNSDEDNQDFLVFDKNFKKIDNITCQRINPVTNQLYGEDYVNQRNDFDLENNLNDYFLITDKSGKKNLLLENLSSSTKLIYDEIYIIPDTKHFVVAMNDKKVSDNDNSEIVFTGIIDSNGKEVPIESYNPLESSLLIGRGNEGLYELNVGGKFGFKDEHGNVIISPKYDEVEPFSDGLAVVYVGDKYGYINKQGEEIIPINFKFDTLAHYLGNEKHYDVEEFRSFRNGFAITEINGKYGIIKKNGSKLFNETFDNIFILNKKNEQGLQLFVVMKKLNTSDYLNEVYGIINEKGEYIITCKYGLIHEFNDVIITALNNKYGLLNKHGNEIFSNQFSSLSESKLNGQSGGFYESNEFFSDEKGPIIVETERKYGLVSSLGKWIIPCKYDVIAQSDICPEYFLISEKNRFGLINKNGEIVIPLIYEGGTTDYGYFEFKLNNERILINRYGKEFFRYTNYQLGRVKVIKNKIGFVVSLNDSRTDSFVKFVIEDGSEIILNNYTDVKIEGGLDYIIVESNNKYGAIDINGKVVLEIKYDKIETFRNKKYCKVHLNGKCELLNFE